MSPEIKRPQPKPRLSLLQNRQDRPGKPESTNKLSTSDSVKDVKDLVADGTDLMRDMNLNDDDEVEDPLDAVVGAFPPKPGTASPWGHSRLGLVTNPII